MVNGLDAIPDAPSYVKGYALERWNTLWPTLDRTRVDPIRHLDTVAGYCTSFGDWREANEQIDQFGVMVKDTKDRVIQNPFLMVRDLAIKQMVELGKILGIRPDMPIAQAPPWNEYAAMLLTKPEDDEDEHRTAGDAGTTARS